MSSLSIGQIARRAGVSIEAVRFYEREGLLDEPPRRASGYRQYSEEAIKGIRFVKRTRQLGFSFEEISDLLTLRVAGQTSCEQIKKRIKAKLASVERKMVELERIQRALKWIASHCTGEGPTSACPMPMPSISKSSLNNTYRSIGQVPDYNA